MFAGGAGQGALENGQEFFRLLLGHQPQGLVELGDDLPIFVDVAAPYMGDVVLIRPETPADFCDFFLVHSCLFLLGRSAVRLEWIGRKTALGGLPALHYKTKPGRWKEAMDPQDRAVNPCRLPRCGDVPSGAVGTCCPGDRVLIRPLIEDLCAGSRLCPIKIPTQGPILWASSRSAAA